MLLVGGALMAVRVERLIGAAVEDAMAGEAEGGLLIGEREAMELTIEVDLVAAVMRWLSLEDGRRLLGEDRLSMLLVGGALMAVRVERLTRRDVEDAIAGEAEDGLLIGEKEEMELVVEVDLVAVDVRWLVLEDGR
jgi:hypothetical protein